MQKVNFNIISRADWEVLSNKQFGYFYFVVDDVTVLDAGGDLYLGENLIGSGLTIEDIVEYFENPENEHTFPGITVGDLVPRGETAMEVTDRMGIHAMAEKRYFSGEEGKLKRISGVTLDYNTPSTTLKCGLNTGNFQNWVGSYMGFIYAVKSNMFVVNAIESDGNYYFVFPCVKGVAGHYGNPDIGTNNGYVVVGGEETFVGYCSSLSPDFLDFDISDYTEMTGTRLDGQPQSDTHTYYIPDDIGFMCVGYDNAPVVTQNQDGSYTVTVNGVEVGCHLAMDNKKDDVAGEAYASSFNFCNNLHGILPSESGPGTCDEIVISGNIATFIQRVEFISANDMSWDYDGGTYDTGNDYYIWRIYGSIDEMKPDGAFAITGGYENAYIDSYTDGNTICITAPGDENGPYDWPNDIDCFVCYELDEPNTEAIQGFSEDIRVSKYGVMFNMDGFIVGDEYGVYTTVEYQQSGGDQIWNAIAYQREMAEVTAAALCDLDSRIGEVDFSGIQSQIDELEDNLEEVSEVTATALNYLNDGLEYVVNGTPRWETANDSSFIGYENYLTLTAETAGSTVALNKNGSPTNISIQYSTNNGSTWSTYTIGNTITLSSVGSNVKFKGNNLGVTTNTSSYYYFSMTGKIAASGSVTSLANGHGDTYGVLGNGKMYVFLFKNCTSLTKANIELADSSNTYMYYGMFYGCTSLVEAPAIPIRSIGSYGCSYMFYDCTSLKVAPKIMATSMNTYACMRMFHGCTSLIVPPELPATTLNTACYQYMFNGCTALTTAPALPATTLAQYCYSSMFNGCTALVNVPSILPATTMQQYCYGNMFYGCTSLTTAPELPATALANYCYQYMFYGCTALTTAPALPATTLAMYCYQGMFSSCTSLVTAPELPATTLTSNCYYSMFTGCSKLNYIKAMFTTTPGSSYTGSWVQGVSSTGTFVKNSAASWTDSFGYSAIPTGWTVETASA